MLKKIYAEVYNLELAAEVWLMNRLLVGFLHCSEESLNVFLGDDLVVRNECLKV